jgi:hypothetical protein
MKQGLFLLALAATAGFASPVPSSLEGPLSDREILEAMLQNKGLLMTPSGTVAPT